MGHSVLSQKIKYQNEEVIYSYTLFHVRAWVIRLTTMSSAVCCFASRATTSWVNLWQWNTIQMLFSWLPSSPLSPSICGSLLPTVYIIFSPCGNAWWALSRTWRFVKWSFNCCYSSELKFSQVWMCRTVVSEKLDMIFWMKVCERFKKIILSCSTIQGGGKTVNVLALY